MPQKNIQQTVTFNEVMAYLNELEVSNRVLNIENEKMRHFVNPDLVSNVPVSVKTASDIIGCHENTTRSYITRGLLDLHPRSTDKAFKVRLSSVLTFKKTKAEKR